MAEVSDIDAVVVGAGFAGMYAIYALRNAGLRPLVFEAGGDVGGTWYWNRYPGARCDVESLEYSYSFSEELQQEWEWTERYAGQPEILRYINHVADRFHLRDDIRFETRVVAATFDGDSNRWTVQTDRGEEVSAPFLIMAAGNLSTANVPTIDGLDDFEGPIYHTGQWPHEGVDFTGLRVAAVGTGSSGIQAIPKIAEQAGQLTVFQRTANYSIPAANGPLDPAEQAQIKADYAGFRERNRARPAGLGSRSPVPTKSVFETDADERDAEFEARWKRGGFGFLGAYNDLALNADANVIAAEFARSKIREIVRDPATAERLSPKQVIGCKRLCLDTNYFETFNRPTVSLIDINETPIERVTPSGIRVGGEDLEFDCIVFATGFDAMTGPLLRVDIKGVDGASLRDAWAAGPVTYLGLGVPGFPNMFIITGPGSPGVLTNMIVSIEHHVDWITACLTWLGDNGYSRIEADANAAEKWVAHVNAVAGQTLYPTCNSWYLGANVPGKPRVFMPLPGFPPYVEKCEEVAATDYDGFVLS
jgi:cyclohexanone monooxygenase